MNRRNTEMASYEPSPGRTGVITTAQEGEAEAHTPAPSVVQRAGFRLQISVPEHPVSNSSHHKHTSDPLTFYGTPKKGTQSMATQQMRSEQKHSFNYRNDTRTF